MLEDPATKKAAEARNQASERLDSANQNLRQGVELVREELTTDGQLPADERRADERLLAALDDAQQDLERGLEEVGQLIAERRQAKRTARAERQAAREAAEAADDEAASEPAPEAPSSGGCPPGTTASPSGACIGEGFACDPDPEARGGPAGLRPCPEGLSQTKACRPSGRWDSA